MNTSNNFITVAKKIGYIQQIKQSGPNKEAKCFIPPESVSMIHGKALAYFQLEYNDDLRVNRGIN